MVFIARLWLAIIKRKSAVYFKNAFKTDLWGSDNICINKNKKFGAKKCGEAPVYGALLFLEGWNYANNENGGVW